MTARKRGNSISTQDISWSGIVPFALEPRYMFDAAGAATGVDAAKDAAAQAEAENAASHGQDGNTDTTDSGAADHDVAVPVAGMAEQNGRRDVVIVDPAVQNYQALIDGLGADVEVILLQQNATVSDIASVLDGMSGIDGLHILSHGATGALNLSGGALTLDTLGANLGALETIGNALSETGDIVLYGCSVGADSSGQAFIDQLAQATGADILASDDATGAAALGGDWDMEAASGEIETGVIFAGAAIESYDTLLAAPNVGVTTFNGLTGTPFSNGSSPATIPPVTDVGGTGWDFAGTMSSSGYAGLSFNSTGGVDSTTSLAAISSNGFNSIVLSSNDGSEFKLNSLAVKNGTANTVGYTITGYRDGSVVTGATATGTLTKSVYTTIDVTGNANFENIDSYTIVFASSLTSLNFDNIDISAAVVVTNSAPEFSGLNGGGSFTEDGSAVVIDSDVTVSDTELDAFNGGAGDYNGATLTITRSGGANGADIFGNNGSLAALTENGALTYNGTTVGTVTTNSSGTLVLSFNSSATTSIVNSVMQNITYSNSSDAPSSSVTLDYTFNDGTDNSTGTNQATVSITAVNDAPTIDSTSDLSAINEDSSNSAGETVSSLVSVSDPDSGASLGGIVVIGNTANAGTEGVWQYSSNGIDWADIGSVADDATALALSAASKIRFNPVADYNGTPPSLTIRAIDNSYSGSYSDSSGSETRQTVNASNNGGSTAISSGSDSIGISVTAVNDAPVVGNLDGDSLTYATGTGGAVVIDQGGAATLTDIDSANFNQGTLTVSFSSGKVNADDQLSVLNQGNGTGQIGLSGTNVTYEGTTIGTLSALPSAGADLVVTLNGSASVEAVQALLRTITYENVNSGSPTAGARTISFVLTDGDGGTSETSAVSLTVTTNDPPVFGGLDGAPTFTEGGSPVVIDGNMTISDTELDSLNGGNGNYNGASLTISRNGGANISDVFGNGGSLGALTQGQDLVYNGTTVGTVTTNDGGTLQLTFNANATTALVNLVMQNLTYSNSSDAPSSSVTLDFTFNDGTSDSTGTNQATVTITPVNDEPTLTATGGTPTFTENGSAVDLFSGVSISTVEAGQSITGYSFTVTNVEGSDRITVDGTTISLINGQSGTTSGNSLNYSVSVTSGTATITLSGGTMTASAAQSVIDGMTYSSVSEDPGTANRVVTLTSITDSGGTANGGDNVAALSVAATVSVVAVNDEPTLTATGGTPTFTENGSAVDLFSGVSISTVEAGQSISGYSFTVTNVEGSDRITVDGTTISLINGQSGTTSGNSLNYSVSVTSGTATITLSGGTMTASAAQTVIDGMTYSSVSEDPGTSNRVVTLTSITDTGGTANGGDNVAALSVAATVSVVAVNDEPTLTATGGTPTFTENGSAVDLFSGVSISTVEAGQSISGYSFTVTNVEGSDRITVDGTTISLINGQSGTTSGNSLNYSVSVTSGTATITLSGGTMTASDAQTVIDGMTYSSVSEDPGTSNRVVTLTSITDSGGTANGGDNVAALSVAATVSVAGLNDEPTLTATGGTPTFTENGSAVDLFSGVSISTVEAGQSISGYSFTVTNAESSDRITVDGTTISLINGQSGTTSGNSLNYSVSVTSGTATITLSGGTMTASDAQTVIDGMTYSSVSEDPGTSNRVVTLASITDSGGTANGGDNVAALSVAATVSVAGVNDAPEATASVGSSAFTEGGSAIAIDGAFTLTDADSANIASATIQITGNYQSGSDSLVFVDQNGISGSFDTQTGTLTLSGSATVAQYQAAIRSITFTNGSDDPSTGNRTVSITVNDGAADSSTVTKTVTVTSVNDEPTLTGTGGTPTFTENGSAVDLFSGVSISTVEAGQSISGYSFTVTNVEGSDRITVDGTIISLVNGQSGTTSGNSLTYSVSVTSGTATITLSGGEMTASDAQTVIDGMTYSSVSEDPGTSNRVVTLTSITDTGGTANGGDNVAALSVAATVSVAGVNDAPEATASVGSSAFTEGGSAIAVDGAFTLTDADSANIASATVQITGNYQSGSDSLVFVDQNGISGSFDTQTGTLTLSGSATVAQYQAAIRSITFTNGSDDPSTGNRTVSITVNDGAADSNTVTKTVTVTSVNDEPTLTGTGGTPTFTENGSAVDLFSGVSISTVEAGQSISGYSFTVTNVEGSDRITVDGTTISLINGQSGTTSGNSLNYSVSVTSGTATITLSGGTMTASDAQTVIDGMTYSSVSEDPGTSNRVVILTSITDTGGTANGGDNVAALSVAATVTVVSVNDAPVISGINGDTVAYSTGSTVLLDTDQNAVLGDLDTGNFNQGTLTVSFSSGGVAGQDILTVANSALVTLEGTSAGSDVLVNGQVIGSLRNSIAAGSSLIIDFNENATTERVQTLMRAVAYTNNATVPTAGTRTIGFTLVDDTDTSSVTQNMTVSVAETPPPPPPPVQSIPKPTTPTVPPLAQAPGTGNLGDAGTPVSNSLGTSGGSTILGDPIRTSVTGQLGNTSAIGNSGTPVSTGLQSAQTVQLGFVSQGNSASFGGNGGFDQSGSSLPLGQGRGGGLGFGGRAGIGGTSTLLGNRLGGAPAQGGDGGPSDTEGPGIGSPAPAGQSPAADPNIPQQQGSIETTNAARNVALQINDAKPADIRIDTPEGGVGIVDGLFVDAADLSEFDRNSLAEFSAQLALAGDSFERDADDLARVLENYQPPAA